MSKLIVSFLLAHPRNHNGDYLVHYFLFIHLIILDFIPVTLAWTWRASPPWLIGYINIWNWVINPAWITVNFNYEAITLRRQEHEISSTTYMRCHWRQSYTFDRSTPSSSRRSEWLHLVEGEGEIGASSDMTEGWKCRTRLKFLWRGGICSEKARRRKTRSNRNKKVVRWKQANPRIVIKWKVIGLYVGTGKLAGTPTSLRCDLDHAILVSHRHRHKPKENKPSFSFKHLNPSLQDVGGWSAQPRPAEANHGVCIGLASGKYDGLVFMVSLCPLSRAVVLRCIRNRKYDKQCAG